MKVQCDVCAAEAASVFCCADEAALCDACDCRVHRANKLAGKHRRLSLLNPSPSSSSQQPPLCDICQEKRGFLFCKEDRAILCRDCDVPVHKASELTMRHSRFLLTGVRFSSAPVASPAPSEEENSSSFCNADRSCGGWEAAACCSVNTTAPAPAPAPAPSASDVSSSSISEYLTKTLPGWHVEDFLMDDAAATAAATAIGVSADGLYQGGVSQISGLAETYPIWVPQEQLFCDGTGDAAPDSRERWVPQMYTEWAGNKRSRTSSRCYW